MNKIKKISIVIPVFNEEATIAKQIKAVLKSNTLSLEKEIIIINDGSSDRSEKEINQFKGFKNVRILHNQKNQGKGYSLKKGFIETTGDIVVVQDGDLEYSPDNYPYLIKPIIDEYADVVYGSRFSNSNQHRVLYFYHYLANKLITTLSNIFTNLNLSDIETGYKVFRGSIIRQLAPNLNAKKFGFEPEVTARIAKIKGIRVYEVGITYFGRTYEEGKKISWIDGVKAVFEIIRYSLLE